jgi:acetolactate synthase I/III small subunit
MSKRTVQTLILMVDNEFGVLTRVTALVRREGWNIKSLVVAETMNPAISRLTISVECIDSTLPRVLDRLGHLACVGSITAYSEESHISRELVMITMGCECRELAIKAAEAIGAHVIPTAACECVTFEFTGSPEHAVNLIAALKPYGIQNIARSGIVTLERPAKEAHK